MELRLQNVPHEIVVVDDGSTDATWPILESLSYQTERHDERVQSVSQKRYRQLQASDRAAFQHHRRAPVKSDRARVFVDGHSDYVAESADWLAEAENQRDGPPLSLHLPLHLARKILQLRRLPARWELILSAPMCAEIKRQSPEHRPPPRLSDSADAVGRCAG